MNTRTKSTENEIINFEKNEMKKKRNECEWKEENTFPLETERFYGKRANDGRSMQRAWSESCIIS